MTRYAKILGNGTLEYAPQNIEGVSNWINDEQAVKAAGYLPLIEEDIPEGQVFSGYVAIGDEIHVVYLPKYKPTYAEERMMEYPPLADQLDMIYWDKVNGTNLWQEKISEIKAKYPKPEVQTVTKKSRKSSVTL